MAFWRAKLLCIIICLSLSFNLGILNFSKTTEAGDSPPIAFGTIQIENKTSDWVVTSTETYYDKVIDLRGNLTIADGGKLVLNNITLRINMTADNQRYKIYVKPGGELQILSNSLITDSPLDVDTGVGQDPDFRYQFFVDHGILIIKDSSIKEVGPYGVYNTFKLQGTQARLNMDNSTLSYSFDGLRLYGTENCVINNSRFININHLAIYFNSVNNSKIQNCYVNNITSYGFHMNYGDNNIIDNCTINKTGNYCIYWYSGTDRQITNCDISNGNSRGIYAQYGDGLRISDCSVYKVSSYGLELYRIANLDIENNSIDYSYYGMYIRSNYYVTNIKNNYVNHTQNYGIWLEYVIDSIIYNNTIDNSQYAFVIYYNVWNCEFSYNKIYRVNYCGMYVNYPKNLEITNNIFKYPTYSWTYGIQFYGQSNTKAYGPFVFENNTIYQFANGIEMYYAYDVKFKNNNIVGTSAGSYGLYLYYISKIRMENNVITNFPYGMYCYDVSYYNDIVQMYGGQFSANTYDMYLYYHSYFKLYNVSIDASKINIASSSYSPYVNLYYNIDVKVSDTKGPIGAAEVTAKEKSGSGFPDIVQLTDSSGWTRFNNLFCIKKVYGTTTNYLYGFTADVSGDTASSSDSSYSAYSKVNINFAIDTKPAPPVNLRIDTDHDSIVLIWECYVNDIESYKIFRNDSAGGWQTVADLNATLIPPGSWKDPDLADDLVEYRYKIHHVDFKGTEELNDDWVVFTDWVFTDHKSYVNRSLKLNGSLIIEQGGHLELTNCSVNMNGTHYSSDIKAIEVRDGGKLVITDYDGNHLTENDTSFINASEAAGYYEFRVLPGGILEMENSRIQNSSFKTPFGDASLFIKSNNASIKNNTILSDGTGVRFVNSDDCTFFGNRIMRYNASSNYKKGVTLFNSRNIRVESNSIVNSSEYSFRIVDSTDVELINNDILMEYNETLPPLCIELINSKSVLIQDNTIHSSYSVIDGVHSTDLTIDNNDFYIKEIFSGTTVIKLTDTISANIINNLIDGQMPNTTGIMGMELINFYELEISDNELRDIEHGFYFENTYPHSKNMVIIKNNSIHDLTEQNSIGIMVDNATGMGFFNNVIYNCHIAVYQKYSQDISFDGDNIAGINYSYFIRLDSEASIINSTISDLCQYPVHLNYNCDVTIINAYFNLSKLIISDPDSVVVIGWGIDVMIKDPYGFYQSGIYLRTRNSAGTILYERYTDIAGCVKYLVITEKIQYYDTSESFNPTVFEAEYANHSTYAEIDIESSMTQNLQLGNQAPSVFNILVKPQLANTSNDLTLDLSYTFVDKENDPENNSLFQWYQNSVHITSQDNSIVVPSNYTAKGDAWFCKIIPYDGINYGNPGQSVTVLIFNTKPKVSNVQLYPSQADGSDDLYVEYEYFDLDSDDELGSLYYWYGGVGGNYELRATTNEPKLAAVYTQEGERWYVDVEPKDGEESGDRVQSVNISIGNTIPRVTNLAIFPANPTSSDDLTIMYDFIDVDNDPEGNTEYYWVKWFPGLPDYVDHVFSGFKTRNVPSQYLTKDEIWWCQVTPHDGSIKGLTVNSSKVVIRNSAPAVSNLMISPVNPGTADDITVNYDFYDKDNDIEQDTIYEWFKLENSKLVDTGILIQILPSIFTSNGEIWVCEIIPSDGNDSGEPVQTAPIQVGNSAPVAQYLTISPENPKTDDDLTASYSYDDADLDPENGTIIKWYKNGFYLPSYDNQFEISSNETEKGDLLYFTVTPAQGVVYGSIYSSDIVEIINTVPEIRNAAIDPVLPTSSDDLTAVYEIYEPDGGDILTKYIKWFKNGIEQEDFADQELIPSDETKKGEIWKYEIHIYDGEETSATYESLPVTLQNSPPKIIAYYPHELVININETDSLPFTVGVIDNDDDVIVIQWFKNGLIVSDEQNFVMTTDHTSAGEYTINVTIQDWGAGSVMVSHEWTVIVNNTNRLPQINVNEPLDNRPIIGVGDILNFEITPTDPDIGDISIITWIVDGETVQTGEDTFSYTGKSSGNHLVTVEVYDGYDSASYTWNVTVQIRTIYQEEFIGITWDQWSIVLEALVIGVTGILAFMGFMTFRKRKGVLQVYLRNIEEIMRNWTDDPDEAEKKLLELSEKIETGFAHNRIEDFHYFLLDRQVKESIREIRQSKIRRGFASLPEHLREQVDGVLEDGRISDKDYMHVVSTISKSEEVSAEDKNRLRKMMRTWKDIDTSGREKKVKVKSIAVKRRTMESKMSADELGWEDFRKEKNKHAPEKLAWEDMGQKKGKRRIFKAAQLGWEDYHIETEADSRETEAETDAEDIDDVEVWR